MANELDLARRGPAQIDRVLVNPTSVRVEDGGQETAAFLRGISQLADTAGGLLAKRAAEQKQRDEAQMIRDAQLKAFNPSAFEAAVAKGEAKEWEHPDFAIRYDAFKAQADEGRLIEGFASVDPNGTDDEIEGAIQQLRGTVGQGSPAYLSAMGPILAEHETRLRSRVGAARLDRQNEEAYANFSASLNAGVNKALRAGDLAGAKSFLDEQITVARGLGQSGAKTAKAILDSAESLVKDHPALADFFDDYEVPGVGRLGDLAPGFLQDVADNEQRARLSEQRAARAEAREAASQQSKAAQRQAWLDLLTGRTPDAQTFQAASYSDPDFMVSWETKRRALATAPKIATDPRAYTTLTAAAARNELTLDELIDAHLGGQIDQDDFDRLSQRITSADDKSGPLKNPVYSKMLGDFRTKAAQFTPSVLGKADGSMTNLDVVQRQALQSAEQDVLDSIEEDVIANWTAIHEQVPAAEQPARAQELRQMAQERAQAELNALRFDPRFAAPLGTQLQPVPPERQAEFDAVPNAAAVFQRLPQVQSIIETTIDPALLERAEVMFAQGDTTPAELTPFLDTLRVQLGLPPGVDDEAIVFALVQHLQP